MISQMTLAVSDAKSADKMYDMGVVVAKPVLEQTYAMIKPNAVAAGATEAILDTLKEAGFKVALIEQGVTLTAAEAEAFYRCGHQKYGPIHLGLWCNVLSDNQMALITSGCAPSTASTPARSSLPSL